MSFYAATKCAAERLLAPFASRLNLIILRPFFYLRSGAGSLDARPAAD